MTASLTPPNKNYTFDIVDAIYTVVPKLTSFANAYYGVNKKQAKDAEMDFYN
jgi:hypothetical protein